MALAVRPGKWLCFAKRCYLVGPAKWVRFAKRPFQHGRPIGFVSQNHSFLAGYAAAATSVSGTVGTFGALDIPPVTQFMAGFTAGADYYSDQTGAAVAVLGWDRESGAGHFTGNFTVEADGYAFAQDLVAAGADMLLPVAGRQGHGAAAYCQESQRCRVIRVDTDWTPVADTQPCLTALSQVSFWLPS